MHRALFGIAGVLVVATLLGLALAPAASATRYDIDVTKTIRGYTVHVVGYIDVDRAAETVSGHLRVTVTDPAGRVVFDRDFDFSFTGSSPARPITVFLPGAGLLVTISFGSMGGLAVTAASVPVPARLTAWRERMDRVR